MKSVCECHGMERCPELSDIPVPCRCKACNTTTDYELGGYERIEITHGMDHEIIQRCENCGLRNAFIIMQKNKRCVSIYLGEETNDTE